MPVSAWPRVVRHRRGDKIKARRVAEACGVAPVPASEFVTSREEVEAFIASAGYPVVLKRRSTVAAARGISINRSQADLDLFFARSPDADLGAHFVERLSRSPVTSRRSPRATRARQSPHVI